ncbi:hypothetical protein AVEN_103258-1 [Araneus ventricosus]|uniref:Uncharacterized protein n=1 Tax=Araneus ventricosus TaxID=182803 RepID=A0A4Y2R6B3_ARAVE|nr:hypothetical protein AVEN_103258-1 [Araneus ventricosus]
METIQILPNSSESYFLPGKAYKYWVLECVAVALRPKESLRFCSFNRHTPWGDVSDWSKRNKPGISIIRQLQEKCGAERHTRHIHEDGPTYLDKASLYTGTFCGSRGMGSDRRISAKTTTGQSPPAK